MDICAYLNIPHSNSEWVVRENLSTSLVLSPKAKNLRRNQLGEMYAF